MKQTGIIIVSGIATLFFTACGGGSSSSSIPVIIPTESPTPTPIPTEAPLSYSTLSDLEFRSLYLTMTWKDSDYKKQSEFHFKDEYSKGEDGREILMGIAGNKADNFHGCWIADPDTYVTTYLCITSLQNGSVEGYTFSVDADGKLSGNYEHNSEGADETDLELGLSDPEFADAFISGYVDPAK